MEERGDVARTLFLDSKPGTMRKWAGVLSGPSLVARRQSPSGSHPPPNGLELNGLIEVNPEAAIAGVVEA
jgi:hypothetical protein